MAGIDEPVLVLDKGWRPLGIINVKKALGLVIDERAKIISDDYSVHSFEEWIALPIQENSPKIQSVSFAFRRPDVILMVGVLGKAKLPVRMSRMSILKRDKFTCQYCGIKGNSRELSLDHVLPKSRGGRTTWTNCVAACKKCNSKKKDTLPGKYVPELTKTPIKPNWASLFPVKDGWEKFIKKGS